MPEVTAIPIIDISAPAEDRAQVAKALVDAAVEYGFVYVRHAGLQLSAKQVDSAFNLSRELFASPLEDKKKCSIQKNNQGWSGMHTETLDPKNQRVGDFKEAFNFGTFAEGKASQSIPPSIEPYQTQLADFREACHELCREILLLFGIGLEVAPPDFFKAAHSSHEPSGSILRFLYYPTPSPSASSSSSSPQDTDAATISRLPTDVRAGAHSDYGSVTLLFRLRGQAGLEILDPKTDSWSPVPVNPPGTEDDPSPPILVNIGDLLSYWTNGLLRSTVHRVTFSPGSESSPKEQSAAAAVASSEPKDNKDGRQVVHDDARYSIVFFCHPANETPLGPVPSERVRRFGLEKGAEGAAAATKKVLTADEHLQMRLRATYLQMYSGDQEEQ